MQADAQQRLVAAGGGDVTPYDVNTPRAALKRMGNTILRSVFFGCCCCYPLLSAGLVVEASPNCRRQKGGTHRGAVCGCVTLLYLYVCDTFLKRVLLLLLRFSFFPSLLRFRSDGALNVLDDTRRPRSSTPLKAQQNTSWCVLVKAAPQCTFLNSCKGSGCGFHKRTGVWCVSSS